MGRIAGIRVSLRARHWMGCAALLIITAFACLRLAGIARAQQEESAPLAAEQIIQILQENPDVLAEAKAQIVRTLRDRGYAVTQAIVSDVSLGDRVTAVT